jgi:hypothetical protein
MCMSTLRTVNQPWDCTQPSILIADYRTMYRHRCSVVLLALLASSSLVKKGGVGPCIWRHYGNSCVESTYHLIQ